MAYAPLDLLEDDDGKCGAVSSLPERGVKKRSFRERGKWRFDPIPRNSSDKRGPLVAQMRRGLHGVGRASPKTGQTGVELCVVRWPFTGFKCKQQIRVIVSCNLLRVLCRDVWVGAPKTSFC